MNTKLYLPSPSPHGDQRVGARPPRVPAGDEEDWHEKEGRKHRLLALHQPFPATGEGPYCKNSRRGAVGE